MVRWPIKVSRAGYVRLPAITTRSDVAALTARSLTICFTPVNEAVQATERAVGVTVVKQEPEAAINIFIGLRASHCRG